MQRLALIAFFVTTLAAIVIALSPQHSFSWRDACGYLTEALRTNVRAVKLSERSLKILKRLGGNENSFGSPLLKLASDGVIETASYVRLRSLLILGNVFPSELKS